MKKLVFGDKDQIELLNSGAIYPKCPECEGRILGTPLEECEDCGYRPK